MSVFTKGLYLGRLENMYPARMPINTAYCQLIAPSSELVRLLPVKNDHTN